MIDKTCEICGVQFSVRPYRKETARFCSQICGGHFHAKERLNKGPKPHLIGNNFRKGKRPKNAFKEGQNSGEKNIRWVKGDERECRNCGKVFHQKPWLTKQNGEAKFCSRACFEKSGIFIGESSPCWVGGKATYRGRKWQQIRMVVIDRQDGNCAKCGVHKGKSLPVHHIVPYREFDCPTEANSLSNLVGLCQSCHMKTEPRKRKT